MKKIIFAFLIILISNTTQAQEHFELEASTGWNFYNRFNDEVDLVDMYVGYGIQSGLDFWFSKKINNTFDARLGVGYANFLSFRFYCFRSIELFQFAVRYRYSDFLETDEIVHYLIQLFMFTQRTTRFI